MLNADLIECITEQTEETREKLFEKYKYIIDIYLRKYKNSLYYNSIDYEDAYSECLYAFNSATESFDLDKTYSFQTFLSRCVERRLIKMIRDASTEKNKFLNSTYSLDYVYKEYGVPLNELIKSNTDDDPDKILETEEKLSLISSKIEQELSEFEHSVYNLMLDDLSYQQIAKILNKDSKQVDNAMQRIKNKLKDIIAKI